MRRRITKTQDDVRHSHFCSVFQLRGEHVTPSVRVQAGRAGTKHPFDSLRAVSSETALKVAPTHALVCSTTSSGSNAAHMPSIAEAIVSLMGDTGDGEAPDPKKSRLTQPEVALFENKMSNPKKSLACTMSWPL